MKVALVALIAVLLTACSHAQVSSSQAVASEPGYKWTKVLDAGPWRKNYNFQMFAAKGKMWVFHPDSTWSSDDGKTWSRSTLTNSIKNLAFLDYVQFRDGIYGLGNFEGNIVRFTLKPEIYRTTDFAKWETLKKDSSLPQRYFYHPFVFKDKIWIIGGEYKERKFADIWNSDDGISWTKQKDNLPFGPRSGDQIVELNGKLYLLGNDVWSSVDGLNWTLETAEIVKGEPIFGYNAVIFDDKIWLLGCNRNGRFSSQVLVSNDGKNWEGKDAPWTPRGGIAATVFNGKLYMTGGKYGGTPDHVDFVYSNDLWALERTK